MQRSVHSALNHSFFSAPHFVFLPCGCLEGDGTLESPLHLRTRGSHPKLGSCKRSPSPFKTCAYICVLSSFQKTADTNCNPALPVVCRAWGERLWGSGDPAALSSGRQAGARPSWDSQTQFLLKPCKKIPGTRIACWDSPSCY